VRLLSLTMLTVIACVTSLSQPLSKGLQQNGVQPQSWDQLPSTAKAPEPQEVTFPGPEQMTLHGFL